MSWEDVAGLCGLARVNTELAMAWLDDCIRYLHEAGTYLEKSGQMLNERRDEINPEAPRRRRGIPARIQPGKQ
jgi:hypothetical protein